jgi:hypothetical protein
MVITQNMKMSNEQREIYNKIIEVAKHLDGKLPDSYRHPKGRNPNAHVFQMIKSKFGCSYKDVINKEKLLTYIDWIKHHPC